MVKIYFINIIYTTKLATSERYKRVRGDNGCIVFHPKKKDKFQANYNCVDGLWKLKPGKKDSCAPRSKFRGSPDYECFPPTGRFNLLKGHTRMTAGRVVRAGPKRPPTGYLLFTMDQRPGVRGEGFKGRDILIQLGARWKALTEAEKDVYRERARGGLEAYRVAHPPKTRAPTGNPQSPALAAFAAWTKEYRLSHPGAPRDEVTAAYRAAHPKN